jgi:hypothetical protein
MLAGRRSYASDAGCCCGGMTVRPTSRVPAVWRRRQRAGMIRKSKLAHYSGDGRIREGNDLAIEMQLLLAFRVPIGKPPGRTAFTSIVSRLGKRSIAAAAVRSDVRPRLRETADLRNRSRVSLRKVRVRARRFNELLTANGLRHDLFIVSTRTTEARLTSMPAGWRECRPAGAPDVGNRKKRNQP